MSSFTEKDTFSLIAKQFNDLLLSYKTLMNKMGGMDSAEEVYGFYLREIPSQKFKKGFYYAVRYKDPKTGEWLDNKKSTKTDDRTKAVAFAIENRERIIKEYKEHIKKIHENREDKSFYEMLETYYDDDSSYLQNDAANNIKIMSKGDRTKHTGFIKRYIIPYLKSQKVKNAKEITKSVYSGLKTYLQTTNLTTKSINNGLFPFNRILKYCERNEIIDFLPFSKGTGFLKRSEEEKENMKQAGLLPTECLRGIVSGFIFDDDIFSYALWSLALTTGCRNSEIGRIKIEDIIYCKKIDTYFLKVYNHKTARFNAERYRKIPLHKQIINILNLYIIQEKRENAEYLFGVPKTDEKGRTDGYLHNKKAQTAVKDFYKRIVMRREDIFSEKKINDTDIEKEMKEKNIVFYSFRHNFSTLINTFLNLGNNNDLTNYFMGQKINNAMRANYNHINKIDNEIFYNQYGKYVLAMLEEFILFPTLTEEAEKGLNNILFNFVEKKLKEEGGDDYSEEKKRGLAEVIKDFVFGFTPIKQETNKEKYKGFFKVE
jgi:integrase